MEFVPERLDTMLQHVFHTSAANPNGQRLDVHGANLELARYAALGCSAAPPVVAGMTYGKWLSRRCSATEGSSPEGTAMLATSDSITSGALSASVRPLKVAKP